MNSSSAHRGSLSALAKTLVSVALLLSALVVSSFAQESWSYRDDRFSGIPSPRLPLVPGHSLIGVLGEGLTVNTGVSLMYDDNQFQTPDNEFAGAIMTSDLSLHYARGEKRRTGVFFGADYNLAYFDYLDEPMVEAAGTLPAGTLPAGERLPGEQALSQQSPRDGRDPFEFGYSGYVGVRGVNTTVTLNGAFDRENGNSTDQRRQQGETLNRSSSNYQLGLDVNRRLSRGSLQAGISYRLQDYPDVDMNALAGGSVQGAGLTDLTSWDGNVGWNHRPQPTPMADFRVGVGFGGSEQTGGVEETHVNPSVGVNYRYSPKTSLFANAGLDFRRTTSTVITVVPASPAATATVPATPGATVVPVAEPMTISEERSFTNTAPTYGFGAMWNADATTTLSASVNQSTSSSALQGQSSYDTRSFTIAGTKQFRRGYFASLDYSLEDTIYTDSSGTESLSTGRAGRPDRYSRFGLTVGRQVQLRPRVSLNMSAFYQYNVGRGDDALSEFEQSVAGIRLGLSF